MRIEIRELLRERLQTRAVEVAAAKRLLGERSEALYNALVQARAERLALAAVGYDDAENAELLGEAEKCEADALELVAELAEKFAGWEPLPSVQLWPSSEAESRGEEVGS